MVFILCFALFLIGLYCAIVKKNIVKIVIGLAVMEAAVNLFLILLGYKNDGTPPIIEKSTNMADFLARSVDPLPQALVLTAIVIGLATTALLIGIAMRIYEKYGTFDITKIRELRG